MKNLKNLKKMKTVNLNHRISIFPCRIGDGGSLSAMTARGGSLLLRKEAITTDAVCGNAKDRPGRARGPRPTWGEASALCVGSDDVGLDSSVH